ncbi:MAG: Holliday junction resolvase RuvX [Deltaproteobacteria bacterium]|nr:Holliday junction resolvase RuvX [Deltaproteobacteria bacterium]
MISSNLPTPTRLLALDVGDKRIGTALSDEMGWTAQPHTTIQRKNMKADLYHIEKIISEFNVCKVIVGFPLNLFSQETPQTQKVKKFILSLEKKIKIPVETWDEAFSSKEAEKLLISADMSRKKRKQVIDKIAAAVILKSYMSAHEKN